MLESLTFLVDEDHTRPRIAESQNIKAEKAVGMAEKATEFKATGSEIYHGKPEDLEEHH